MRLCGLHLLFYLSALLFLMGCHHLFFFLSSAFSICSMLTYHISPPLSPLFQCFFVVIFQNITIVPEFECHTGVVGIVLSYYRLRVACPESHFPLFHHERCESRTVFCVLAAFYSSLFSLSFFVYEVTNTTDSIASFLMQVSYV